jgi:hypothetical protein
MNETEKILRELDSLSSALVLILERRAQLIEQLSNMGASYRTIARAAGISHTQAMRIAKGEI